MVEHAASQFELVGILGQVALLIVSGVMSLLLRGAGKKLDDLAVAVRDMGRELEMQGRQLARGDQRFEDLERRVADIESRLREHERAAG